MRSGSANAAIHLPPALLAEVEAVASDEHRAVADVLREVVEQGLGERRWKARAEQENQRARTLGPPVDDEPVTDDYRRVIQEKIAAGLQSLRDGKGTDGEAFFAELDAEFNALEHKEH